MADLSHIHPALRAALGSDWPGLPPLWLEGDGKDWRSHYPNKQAQLARERAERDAKEAVK